MSIPCVPSPSGRPPLQAAHLVDTSSSCTFHTGPPGTEGQVTWHHEDHSLKNQTDLDWKQDATTTYYRAVKQYPASLNLLPHLSMQPAWPTTEGCSEVRESVRKAPSTWCVVVIQGVAIIITVIKSTAGTLFSLSVCQMHLPVRITSTKIKNDRYSVSTMININYNNNS